MRRKQVEAALSICLLIWNSTYWVRYDKPWVWVRISTISRRCILNTNFAKLHFEMLELTYVTDKVWAYRETLFNTHQLRPKSRNECLLPTTKFKRKCRLHTLATSTVSSNILCVWKSNIMIKNKSWIKWSKKVFNKPKRSKNLNLKTRFNNQELKNWY